MTSKTKRDLDSAGDTAASKAQAAAPVTARPTATPTAILVPGDRYTVDMPQLFWAWQALEELGFAVVKLRWDDPGDEQPDRRVRVAKALDAAEAELGGAPTLIVGRSSGCLAAELRPDVPFFGYSPVSIPGTPSSLDESLRRTAPSAAVAGLADPVHDRGRLEAMGFTVMEFPGLPHSLMSPAGWRESMAVLRRATALLEDFALPLLRIR